MVDHWCGGENDLDSVVLVTGGYDGKVEALLVRHGACARVRCAEAQCSDGPVSTACLNYDRRKVLVGTRGSEIFEFMTNDESDLNKGPLVSGHCAGSFKALLAIPSCQVATVGDDGYLRTWSLTTHKQLRKLNVGYASRRQASSRTGHEAASAWQSREERFKDAGKVLIVSHAQT